MLNNHLSRPVYQAKHNGTYQVYLVKVNHEAGTAKVCQRIQHTDYNGPTEERISHSGHKYLQHITKHKPGWTIKPYTVQLFVLFETRLEAQEARKINPDNYRWDNKAKTYGRSNPTATSDML